MRTRRQVLSIVHLCLTPGSPTRCGRSSAETSARPVNRFRSRSDIRKWALAIYYPEVPPHSSGTRTTRRTRRTAESLRPRDSIPSPGSQPRDRSCRRTTKGDPQERRGGSARRGRASDKLHPERRSRVRPRRTDARPGDVITSGLTKLVEYRERQTRLGLMLITITETTWTNQKREMVRVTRGTGLRY